MMLPRWSTLPLHRSHDWLHEHDRVLQLSMQGITQIANGVPLVEALAALERDDDLPIDPESEHRIASARVAAEFARTEIDGGFPILHGHATVALWGVLEATVSDLALAFLENDATCLAHPALAAVRIPLAEFEQYERYERVQLLLSEYLRSSKADLRVGVGRFETTLQPVGLSGAVPEELRRNIVEHQQVRNVLVHCAGRADRRLVERCPWMGVTSGTRVRVSHDQYGRYQEAVDSYLIEIMTRMLVRSGLTRVQAEARLASKSES